MFKDNSLKGVLRYFQDKLESQYPVHEIQLFFEWICAHFFQLTKTDLLLGERRFSESELLTFRSIVKRLKTNEPIQHIVGEVEVYGLNFTVNKHVLIPRPETEEMVDLICKNEHPTTILDIGTGSGIIPICLKHHFPKARVEAIDISKEALEIAQKNARLNQVEVEFFQKDILCEALSKEYDLVVSNPPYVLESDKSMMHENVLQFDPPIALFVPDSDPLKFYNRIIELSQHSLLPNGKIYFEVHEKFGQEVANKLTEFGFQEVEVIQDLQGKDRIVRAKKSPDIN